MNSHRFWGWMLLREFLTAVVFRSDSESVRISDMVCRRGPRVRLLQLGDLPTGNYECCVLNKGAQIGVPIEYMLLCNSTESTR